MEKVYVLGGSQTDYERNWKKEGKNVIALLTEVLNDSLKEVNISKTEIIELNKKNRISAFIGNFNSENYINQGHLGALLTLVDPCFYGVPSARYEAACASSSVALDNAITKIKAGDIDVAIVVGFELMKTVDSKLCGDILGQAAYYEKEGKNIDFPFPKLFGRLADEILEKYKTDEKRLMKNLAVISNLNYQNAKNNPNAQTRKWFMSELHSNSRGSEFNPLVGGKLANSDCSQITDGAAVVILVSEKYLNDKKIDNKQIPVVKGVGHRVAPMLFDDKIKESKDNEYILPWTRQAVVDAYNQANLRLQDINVFETHDCFTSSEYVAISCFGITKPGHEYEAIESGEIFLTGKYPINPSGGLIGCGHPVGASGCRMFLDLYKQVTNKAGNYQVKNVKNAMMLNIGGSATTSYVFIIGKNE